LIARLEERESRAAALADELGALKAEYEKRVAALAEEKARHDAHAARLQQEAYAEAARVLREARRQANLVIRELRHKADVAAAEAQRERLLETEKAAAAEAERLAAGAAPETEAAGEIVAGARVKVRGTATAGQVAEVDAARRRARVTFGGVEAWVDLGDLLPSAGKARGGRAAVPAAADVPPSLNLIGYTVEEALLELGRYLDRAGRAALPGVEIIHGHGTGRLRDGIRQYLRTHEAVASYGPGPRGNEGVTLVRFRD
jgi:DNA mismatch repair protein MutS2